MEFRLAGEDLAAIEADAVIGLVTDSSESESPVGEEWNRHTSGLFGEIVARNEFKGKHRSTALIHNPVGLRAGRLLLAGCGDRSKLTLARVRDAAGTAWRQLRTAGVRSLAATVPDGLDANEGVRAVVEGILLADYESDTHKTDEKDRSVLESLAISVRDASQDALDRAVATAEGQNRARELANEPGNLLTPSVLASRVTGLAQDTGLECEVLDQARLESLKMGALLGVARGSKEPPVMIVVRYQPDAPAPDGPHLGLVGKAVTFDTGGISLKPPADMHLMKHDMAGGAAMIGAVLAIAALKPSVAVTAVIPSVENMPGGEAQRPGDIVTTRSGTTVEVLNTDAEGRLILADALTYAAELGCTHLVDAATLTGAIVVALGNVYTGLFGNDKDWTGQVVQASRRAGEKMWPMPLGEEYSELLRSPVADVANIGPRWGGAITAAAFLARFAGDTPWVHLDIAGTAWFESKQPHAPVGASGAGVPTLVELALAIG